MHRLLALYGNPRDPEHFKKYYEETHLPLAMQLPGLLSSRYSFGAKGMDGSAAYFCVWEGDFSNEEAMNLALQSKAGQKVVADVPNYATGDVELVNFSVKTPSFSSPNEKEIIDNTKIFSEGMQIRREMFGPPLSDEVWDSATDFNRILEEIVTRYCFGEVWTRPQLDRRTRSMLTMALLIVLNKPTQLKGHVRGAINNGVTKDEIREVILHSMIYAGVPAGYDGCNQAMAVLTEMGL
jgi:4-carboxymuconolactone decarboxylase